MLPMADIRETKIKGFTIQLGPQENFGKETLYINNVAINNPRVKPNINILTNDLL